MPLPDDVTAVRPQLMREEVYRALRHWIVDGTLQPGEKVRDVDLAARLAVSRMPVREALHRLAGEGFVEMSPNRWTRVTRIDPRDARTIYPIIWTLESLAIEIAAPGLRDTQFDEMAAANERLRSAIDGGDAVAASRADAAFHDVYIAAAGNPELAAIVARLKLKLRRLEIAYFGGSSAAVVSVREHARLLEALRRRDGAAAGDLVRLNWQQSLERVLAAQAHEPTGPDGDPSP
jgi:DNA-binding GntR family transcriptional regulator